MKTIALFGALALWAVASLARAEGETLRIGTETAYPPFSYKTPDGAIAGFDHDIGMALCEEMQVQCTWVESEFDNLIPLLKAGKVDALLASMSITAERRKSVDFSAKYYATPARLVMRAADAAGDLQRTLKDRKIGVQRSSVHDRYATQVLTQLGAEVVRYSTQKEVFAELAAGRLGGALADSVSIAEGFLNTPAGNGFAFAGPPLTDAGYFGEGQGIAVRKGDQALADRFSAAIQAIRANGKYQAVQDRYFDFDIYGK